MGTVSKALSLLTIFNQSRLEIGLSEMARLAGVNKATAYRLLTELQEAGFVEQVGSERSYRLGAEILRLARLRETSVPLVSASRPIIEALSEATHETSHFSAVSGTTLHTLAHAYSNRYATRVMMDDAETVTFHATASGLAILAFSSDAFIDTILSLPLKKHTPDTLTDPEKIRTVLRRIRATGVAVSVGGFEADVHSHGSPVFDANGVPIAAVAVAAPVSRVTPDSAAATARAVLHAASELTRAIGGFQPDAFPKADAA